MKKRRLLLVDVNVPDSEQVVHSALRGTKCLPIIFNSKEKTTQKTFQALVKNVRQHKKTGKFETIGIFAYSSFFKITSAVMYDDNPCLDRDDLSVPFLAFLQELLNEEGVLHLFGCRLAQSKSKTDVLNTALLKNGFGGLYSSVDTTSNHTNWEAEFTPEGEGKSGERFMRLAYFGEEGLKDYRHSLDGFSDTMADWTTGERRAGESAFEYNRRKLDNRDSWAEAMEVTTWTLLAIGIAIAGLLSAGAAYGVAGAAAGGAAGAKGALLTIGAKAVFYKTALKAVAAGITAFGGVKSVVNVAVLTNKADLMHDQSILWSTEAVFNYVNIGICMVGLWMQAANTGQKLCNLTTANISKVDKWVTAANMAATSSAKQAAVALARRTAFNFTVKMAMKGTMKGLGYALKKDWGLVHALTRSMGAVSSFTPDGNTLVLENVWHGPSEATQTVALPEGINTPEFFHALKIMSASKKIVTLGVHDSAFYGMFNSDTRSKFAMPYVDQYISRYALFETVDYFFMHWFAQNKKKNQYGNQIFLQGVDYTNVTSMAASFYMQRYSHHYGKVTSPENLVHPAVSQFVLREHMDYSISVARLPGGDHTSCWHVTNINTNVQDFTIPGTNYTINVGPQPNIYVTAYPFGVNTNSGIDLYMDYNTILESDLEFLDAFERIPADDNLPQSDYDLSAYMKRRYGDQVTFSFTPVAGKSKPMDFMDVHTYDPGWWVDVLGYAALGPLYLFMPDAGYENSDKTDVADACTMVDILHQKLVSKDTSWLSQIHLSARDVEIAFLGRADLELDSILAMHFKAEFDRKYREMNFAEHQSYWVEDSQAVTPHAFYDYELKDLADLYTTSYYEALTMCDNFPFVFIEINDRLPFHRTNEKIEMVTSSMMFNESIRQSYGGEIRKKSHIQAIAAAVTANQSHAPLCEWLPAEVYLPDVVMAVESNLNQYKSDLQNSLVNQEYINEFLDGTKIKFEIPLDRTKPKLEQILNAQMYLLSNSEALGGTIYYEPTRPLLDEWVGLQNQITANQQLFERVDPTAETGGQSFDLREVNILPLAKFNSLMERKIVESSNDITNELNSPEAMAINSLEDGVREYFNGLKSWFTMEFPLNLGSTHLFGEESPAHQGTAIVFDTTTLNGHIDKVVVNGGGFFCQPNNPKLRAGQLGAFAGCRLLSFRLMADVDGTSYSHGAKSVFNKDISTSEVYATKQMLRHRRRVIPRNCFRDAKINQMFLRHYDERFVYQLDDVALIEEGAFEGCKTNWCDLPVTIVHVEKNAFRNFQAPMIELPWVRAIEDNAFQASLIYNVIVSNRVTMGDEVFLGCTALQTISFVDVYTCYYATTTPASFQATDTDSHKYRVNESNFLREAALKNTEPSKWVSALHHYRPGSATAVNHFFDADGNGFLYGSSRRFASVEDWDAFRQKYGIHEYHTPEPTLNAGAHQVYSANCKLGARTFKGCSSLFEFPTGASNGHVPIVFHGLGEECFMNCSKLAHVGLGSTLTHIPARCFKNCTSLLVVSDLTSVTHFGEECFMNTDIPEFVVSPSLVEVGVGTFENCNLKEFVCPASLKKIGARAFKNCKNLRFFDASRTTDLEVHPNAFDGCALGTFDVSFLKMPSGFDQQVDQYFSNVTEPPSVVVHLPSNVDSINSGAQLTLEVMLTGASTIALASGGAFPDSIVGNQTVLRHPLLPTGTFVTSNNGTSLLLSHNFLNDWSADSGPHSVEFSVAASSSSPATTTLCPLHNGQGVFVNGSKTDYTYRHDSVHTDVETFEVLLDMQFSQANVLVAVGGAPITTEITVGTHVKHASLPSGAAVTAHNGTSLLLSHASTLDTSEYNGTHVVEFVRIPGGGVQFVHVRNGVTSRSGDHYEERRGENGSSIVFCSSLVYATRAAQTKSYAQFDAQRPTGCVFLKPSELFAYGAKHKRSVRTNSLCPTTGSNKFMKIGAVDDDEQYTFEHVENETANIGQDNNRDVIFRLDPFAHQASPVITTQTVGLGGMFVPNLSRQLAGLNEFPKVVDVHEYYRQGANLWQRGSHPNYITWNPIVLPPTWREFQEACIRIGKRLPYKSELIAQNVHLEKTTMATPLGHYWVPILDNEDEWCAVSSGGGFLSLVSDAWKDKGFSIHRSLNQAEIDHRRPVYGDKIFTVDIRPYVEAMNNLRGEYSLSLRSFPLVRNASEDNTSFDDPSRVYVPYVKDKHINLGGDKLCIEVISLPEMEANTSGSVSSNIKTISVIDSTTLACTTIPTTFENAQFLHTREFGNGKDPLQPAVDSNLKSLTVGHSNPVTYKTSCLESCVNLEKISLAYEDRVYEKAFKGCKKLQASLPVTTEEESALEESKNKTMDESHLIMSQKILPRWDINCFEDVEGDASEAMMYPSLRWAYWSSKQPESAIRIETHVDVTQPDPTTEVAEAEFELLDNSLKYVKKLVRLSDTDFVEEGITTADFRDVHLGLKLKIFAKSSSNSQPVLWYDSTDDSTFSESKHEFLPNRFGTGNLRFTHLIVRVENAGSSGNRVGTWKIVYFKI